MVRNVLAGTPRIRDVILSWMRYDHALARIVDSLGVTVTVWRGTIFPARGTSLRPIVKSSIVPKRIFICVFLCISRVCSAERIVPISSVLLLIICTGDPGVSINHGYQDQ